MQEELRVQVINNGILLPPKKTNQNHGVLVVLLMQTKVL